MHPDLHVPLKILHLKLLTLKVCHLDVKGYSHVIYYILTLSIGSPALYERPVHFLNC